MKRLVPVGIVASAAAAVDQLFKWLVESGFELHVPYDVLPFMALFRTHNKGIAFSMFEWLGDTWLVVIPVAIVLFVAWLAWRTAPEQWIARYGFALIIGGAIGNLVDRFLHGHVVDYVLIHIGDWSFAIFNMADAFITVGAGLVLLQELLDWRRRPESRP